MSRVVDRTRSRRLPSPVECWHPHLHKPLGATSTHTNSAVPESVWGPSPTSKAEQRFLDRVCVSTERLLGFVTVGVLYLQPLFGREEFALSVLSREVALLDVALVLALALAVGRCIGLYRVILRRPRGYISLRGALTLPLFWAGALAGIAACFSAAGIQIMEAQFAFGTWIFATIGTGIIWRGCRVVVARAESRTRRIVFVGAGRLAARRWRQLQSAGPDSYDLLGFVDVPESPKPELPAPLLGNLADLEQLLASRVVDEIHLALPLRSYYDQSRRVVGICERAGVSVFMPASSLDHHRSPYVGGSGQGIYVGIEHRIPSLASVLKRMMDIIVSAVGLILAAPVLVICALVVAATSRGSPVFRQVRIGRDMRLFHIYKLRTMRGSAEIDLVEDPELYSKYVANDYKIPLSDDPRLTKIGRFLRRFSLDELPQLWNVLMGDMSLVGPRPIVPPEASHYGSTANLFSVMRPGLTGAWVVSGRNDLRYPERSKVELDYVREWSLALDVSILRKTIRRTCSGEGNR